MQSSFDHRAAAAASMATILLCIIFSIVLICFLAARNGKKRHYHPIGGTVLHQLMNFSRLHDYMTDLAGKYKTYRLIGLFRNEVYTSDPANVEYMLKTNFDNYAKGEYNHSILKDLLGDGIFAVDGEKWSQQRKVSSYEFSTRVLRDFSSVVFRHKVVNLANILSQAATSNEAMDIQDLFMKATLDSIFRVAFGIDLDTIGGSNKEGVVFGKAFDEANAMTLWRYVDVSWRVKRALNVGSEASLKRSGRVMDEFVYKLISTKIEKMHNAQLDDHDHDHHPSIQVKKHDILSRFLATETNVKYLRDITLNFMIAGKDTTATTLSWFIYMMCKHPRVQEQVAKEGRVAADSLDDDVAGFSDFAYSLTEEALEKMHYLHAALTETLRLYPAVPVDPKVCLSEDTMPDGFNVKKGDMVAYQPYAMGRMKWIWGEDAQDYKPERWLDDNGCFRHESPFKFTAFQAGPRICLGKEFAYRQMKIFAALLLRFFIFKLSDERQLVKYRTMITLQIDGGLSIRAFHRIHKN